jgi:Asp-tRNA(Asn)/Glu-tRNA(Gln) amidotransferase B subunit
MVREKIEVKLTMNKELWKKFKEAVINKYDSEKALSLTITSFIKDFLNENEAVEKTNTHTHETKKGIEDIMEFIEDNYPQGITKQKIDEAIKEFKGMDTRTIRKYEPEIIKNILLKGYQPHPKNSNLFLRDNMTLSKPEAP